MERGGASVRDLKNQFASALLVIVTLAVVSCALINFQQQSKFHLPDDGAVWGERGDAAHLVVVALDVTPGSAADHAGIRTGDVLLRIKNRPILHALDVAVALQGSVMNDTEYTIERHAVETHAHVIVDERLPDSALYYQYAVGLAYLFTGLFVFFRRASAGGAVHFYVLCLASFVLHCFHYTGKLNNFDEVIYWGNVAAGYLAPAIFLHFCLVFPVRLRGFGARLRALALYAPAVLLLTVHVMLAQGVLRVSAPPVEIRWFLDRLWLVYFAVSYLLGSTVLALQVRRTDDPVVGHQLKYLRNGAFLGILPFAALYVIPFVAGAIPGHYQRIAVLSLGLIPVTWAYAVLRYRLMDVDIIFQQGYVYTLATLCVLAIFYGLIFSFAKPENLNAVAIVGLILFATFIFQPIRDWLQEQLDRYFFYKDSYDHRRTLIEFARELSSETNLDATLQAVAERLAHTLNIPRVAFFVASDAPSGFRLRMSFGAKKDRAGKPAADPDLSFLEDTSGKPYLFFERTRHMLDALSVWTPAARASIGELDLTYYFPCPVRAKTIAYLGLSRTAKGDFLSSDDVELMISLCGYLGIAIENARLYHTLQTKAEEYERLKEFSENIVESINVGILAADLEDRVDSWNTQIERLTGISRQAATGRKLSDLFPEDLCQKLEQVRGDTSVHNFYKFTLLPRAAHPHSGANGNGARREVTVNVAVAPLVSKELRQIGRLIIFDDVTDRDELERRLVQADKLSSIGLLAAGVAHEVNTPLAVISTYAQMLAKQISGDDPKSPLLEKIAKQTFRASEIVNSLLNFSRTGSTELIEVDLNRIIRDTLGLIDHQLRKGSIQTELRLDAGLPPIKGNTGKLQQVFLNLFLNARDAMEAGGTLAVRTWSEGSTARVEVADSGTGIPSENVSRIYDPFFTTKGAKKGTGLGLSVTYGIVREHGGAIEVDSQPGSGAHFQLAFPVSRKPVHAN